MIYKILLRHRSLRGDILERFKFCRKKLHPIQVDLGMIVETYQLLIIYISNI